MVGVDASDKTSEATWVDATEGRVEVHAKAAAARSASRRDGIGVSALSDRAARVVTRVALAVRKRDVRRAEAGTTCDGTVARDAIDIGGRMADYTRERLW
tara:strand:- start:24940 stop:25239 length:300 start_codon:yes stop_codon:yes gene_type:complete